MSVSKFLKKIFDLFRKQKIGGCAGGQKVRVIGVAMVKNEADIIELFIKINSRFFHEIHILDHRSSDQTATIVKALQSSGYPVKYVQLENSSGDYKQAETTTAYVQQVARDVDCDYIMPIDADEFPYFKSHQKIEVVLSAAMRDCGYCLIPWVTYCPINDNYFSSNAPLYENFRARNTEPAQYYKVILTRSFARTVELCKGNHNISEAGQYRAKKIRAILQHVPARSAAQITSKAIIGSTVAGLDENRKKGEMAHWDEMAEKILSKGMQLSHADVLDIALNYAKPQYAKRSPRISILCPYPRIGTPDDAITLKNLCTVDAQKNIGDFKRAIDKTERQA